MVQTGLTTIAGCLTPTEILGADQAGAHAIKIFPADAVGPRYLTALRGPFPHLKLIPTGGIGPGEVSQWIDAGALAVGMGGRLARPIHGTHDHCAVVTLARELSQAR
jgi:2-dehydro-3-deoxyphosphogluconate aldolase/(4S)-4-hydroxy-2-oxoglutarate aldolase